MTTYYRLFYCRVVLSQTVLLKFTLPVALLLYHRMYVVFDTTVIENCNISSGTLKTNEIILIIVLQLI